MTALSAVFSVLSAAAVLVLLVGGYFAHVTRRIAREAERQVPALGKFITIDGREVHYVERGEGPPILLIHGLGGTLHHLRRPLMEEFGDGYRLIAMDRPGSGYSTRGAGWEGRLSEQAHFVHRFIEELGLERPLLVGHSLGGAVALAAALDRPGAVSGLALISPLTHFEEEVKPEFEALAIRSPLRRRLIAHTLAVPMSVKNSRKTIDFVFGPQQPPADYAVEGGALAGLRPGHFYATSTDLVALEHELPRLEKRYGELKVPVGILFGDSDRVLDHRRHGLAMKGKVADLDLEIVEGVGHMPQYAVTAKVVTFIRRMAEKAFAGRQ
ncbi:alpha/beta fold hydrolase [Aquamicrobium sp. LC103]|uniref:alpha/beta fold hydrolase n=1 Tax=Aquamicrobium sp. LC103 TaxID=1120658 RepID=UPI00063E8863|nr:alpha/beta fold hydrolase [Aquamicrobium sp. LC103]TKT79058.1 alpha/beta fold hydrolase [Aquamicrobium sp. LC103]